MQPFSAHTKFFSSLKQVEKRLKSEHTPTPPQPSSTKPTSSSTTDELTAPLYLYPSDQSTNTNNDTQSSHPPPEFLSPSQDFHPPPPTKVQEIENGKNGIQEVLELLGLLEIGKEEGKSGMKNVKSGCCGDGGDGESFYSKIVGVKGPKSEKEMERLNGWIKYFLESKNGEGVMEPLRLVHLLIGKAVVASEEEGSSGGFGDIEFPSTVEEFLQHDPPT